MIAILDTNILLSALHTGSGPPTAILDAWRAGRFKLLTSVEQIAEFKRAAGYPQLREHLPRRAVGKLVKELNAADIVLERLRRGGEVPDPCDDYLLAMAAAADADFLVTGDKSLLSLRHVGVTSIVTPRRFVALVSR